MPPKKENQNEVRIDLEEKQNEERAELEENQNEEQLDSDENRKKARISFDIISQQAAAQDEQTKDAVVTRPEAMLQNQKPGKDIDVSLDRARYLNKLMLKNLAAEYLDVVARQEAEMQASEKDTRKKANLESLKRALNDIRSYSDLDVTAYNKDDGQEAQLYDQILKQLSDLSDDIQDQQLDRDVHDTAFNELYGMTEVMKRYFEGQREGNLLPPKDEDIEVKAVGVKIESPASKKTVVNTDAPLFPHDPSYSDIIQGALGDCYLVSTLSAIALHNPQRIKDAMVDNGDGTVTVRFWQRNRGTKGPGVNDTFEPFYVKVDKVAPAVGSARDCVWVQTLERAYAASGLYLSREDGLMSDADCYAKHVPSPGELKDMYDKYKAMDRADLPSHDECPWLIDTAGNLHPYVPSYANVDGGKPGLFAQSFLGPDFQEEYIKIEDYHRPREFTSAISAIREMLYKGIETSVAYYNKSLTEEQKLNIRYDLRNGHLRTEDLIYKALNMDPDVKAPRTVIDGVEMVDSVPLDSRMCCVLLYELELFMKNVCSDSTAQETGRERFDVRGFRDFMAHLDDRKLAYEEDEPHKAARKYLMTIPACKILMDGWIDDFEENARKLFEDNERHPKYSGVYNQNEKDLLRQIEESLDHHLPITLETKSCPTGGGDTSVDRGLNYSHAYAVTGIEKRNANGKELLFVKVRNPHGSTGRKYAVTSGGEVYAYGSDENVNGESLIELSDLFDSVSGVTINQKRQPADHDHIEPIKDPIEVETASKYFRAMESIMEKLNNGSSFSRNSGEYLNFKEKLQTAMNFIGTVVGKPIEKLSNELKPVMDAAKKYTDYCDAHQKSGSVRAERLEAAAAVKLLGELAEKKYRDPRAGARIELAKKLTEEALPVSRESTKERAAAALMGNPKFQSRYAKRGFAAIAKDFNRSGNKIFGTVTDLMQQAPQAAAQSAQPKKPGPGGISNS